MIHNFGLKYGLDPDRIIPVVPRVIPPLALIVGGIGLGAWTVSDYYDMVEFGMYDEEFMEKSLWSGLGFAIFLAAIGIILFLVLNAIHLLYKSGYFSVWGFSYDDETHMLSVHKFHKKREFYIGDLSYVKISNGGLDINGKWEAYRSNRRTSFGYIHVYFEVNGKKKRVSPYGMLCAVEDTANMIYQLYSNGTVPKEYY